MGESSGKREGREGWGRQYRERQLKIRVMYDGWSGWFHHLCLSIGSLSKLASCCVGETRTQGCYFFLMVTFQRVISQVLGAFLRLENGKSIGKTFISRTQRNNLQQKVFKVNKFSKTNQGPTFRTNLFIEFSKVEGNMAAILDALKPEETDEWQCFEHETLRWNSPAINSCFLLKPLGGHRIWFNWSYGFAKWYNGMTKVWWNWDRCKQEMEVLGL